MIIQESSKLRVSVGNFWDIRILLNRCGMRIDCKHHNIPKSNTKRDNSQFLQFTQRA